MAKLAYPKVRAENAKIAMSDKMGLIILKFLICEQTI
jgi:hypothetical protein